MPPTQQIPRRSLSKIALAGVGVLGVSSLATPAAQAAASDIVSVSAARRQSDTQALLKLMNDFRAENGVGALRHSEIVASVMEEEARRQYRQGYFSHGTKFIYDSRVQGYSFVREIIALSYRNSLEDLLNFWKSSPAHRAALLAPQANVCGIGFGYGSGGTLPWRVLANVGIYRYDGSTGPNDYQSVVAPQVTTVQETYPVVNGIASRYYADGGASYYGNPLSAEVGGLTGGGARQTFRDSQGKERTIYWSPNTGAYATYDSGAIAARWRRNGAESGFYGYPATNEYGGLIEGGYYQSYRNDGTLYNIFWHPRFGTGSVNETGYIGSYWRQNGAERGFGYPVGDERAGILGGGSFQSFLLGSSKHTLLWHPSFGTHAIKENGAIGRAWSARGRENGLGYPLTDEYVEGTQIRQRFSNGYILAWDSFTGAITTLRG